MYSEAEVDQLAKEIVDAWQVEPSNRLLWNDPVETLANAKYQKTTSEMNKKAILLWWMYLYLPGSSRLDQSVYSSWSNSWYGEFKYVFPRGGYYLDTNQTSLSISPYKHESTQDHVDELQFWLPHVKPINVSYHDEQYKPITGTVKELGIFEASLSYHCSYRLIITTDNQYVVLANRRTVKTFDSIEPCVQYLQQHLFYEKRHQS